MQSQHITHYMHAGPFGPQCDAPFSHGNLWEAHAFAIRASA